MAARAIGAGHGVNREQFVCLVHVVHASQGRMQAVKAPEVEQPVRLAGGRGHDFTTQAGQARVAVRNDGGHAVQGSAQNDYDHALIGGGRGQCQTGAADADGGGDAEQRGAAGDGHGISASEIRDW
jgi:hypothetical protein